MCLTYDDARPSTTRLASSATVDCPAQSELVEPADELAMDGISTHQSLGQGPCRGADEHRFALLAAQATVAADQLLESRDVAAGTDRAVDDEITDVCQRGV